jgi:anti-sigma B factor antagonist
MTDNVLNVSHKLADNGAVIITLEGAVDSITHHLMARTIKQLFQEKRFRLVIDFTNVSYLASAGIGVLINALSESQANKGNIVILSPTATVRQTLTLFGLNEIIPVAQDRKSATALFK